MPGSRIAADWATIRRLIDLESILCARAQDGRQRVSPLAGESDKRTDYATDMREGGQSRRLLTTKAKAIIRSAIDAGLYHRRDHRVEPPFMAPSNNPDHYPLASHTLVSYSGHTLISQKWCTYCNDFGEDLVLCLGCRNAVCLATTDDPTGCLKWIDAVEDDPDFTWECFTCTRGKRAMTVSTVLSALPVAH